MFLINIIDTLAMAAHFLSKIRRDEKFNIDTPKQDMSVLVGTIRRANGTQQLINHQKQNKNPFSNRVNPFGRRR